MTVTPRSNRLHIALFGKRNSGKSSLVNALTHQKVALVSDIAGTTTDPVYQAMEIPGLGSCVWIDTAGFDDEGELGLLRVGQTLKALEKTDIALLVCPSADIDKEIEWVERLREKKIPILPVLSKTDLIADVPAEVASLENHLGISPLAVSALKGTGIEDVLETLKRMASEEVQPAIVSHLVGEGSLVLLVMPQDIQAPKGRLILPKVQTLREL